MDTVTMYSIESYAADGVTRLASTGKYETLQLAKDAMDLLLRIYRHEPKPAKYILTVTTTVGYAEDFEALKASQL